MYEELFQTTDRPFRATPDVRFYFPFDSMEQTRQTVLRAVRRAEGPVAVMGGAGLGKSFLATMLGEDLADRFDVVRLHAARLCSRRAMLQNILFELQMTYRDLSEGELRLSLMERMEPSPGHAAEGLALIVDEAQTLPTKLLEELRLITNFARGGQSRARLVLLGSLQLEETLAMPEMSSFNQRLAARCFLQPMNRVQTADFVRHQFTCAGVDPKQVITRDALENVYVASEGIPRLVNQVMDHALILAIASDQYPISASLIQEAWSDLQQLPMAWSQTEPAQSAPVEFGSIDDLDQDFELEPEGMEDLDSPAQHKMNWPAPSDLEDFGPSAEPPTVQVRSASTGRVVFDASAMFGNRSSPSSDSKSAAPVSAKSGASHTQPTPISSTSDVVTSGSMPTSMTMPGDQDMFIFREDEDTTAGNDSSTVVRNMFAAWNPSPDTYSFEIELPISALGMSSAESTEFEESDYKLAAWPEDNNPAAVPMPIAHQVEMQTSDPFGQDFDEEFEVEATDVQRWQARQRERTQTSAPADFQQSAYGYDLEPQSSAISHPAFNVEQTEEYDEAIATESVVVQPNYSQVTPFVAMTASGAVDERLYAEIEDMISQLNFSAFSVEMDSVEQISPDCIRQAAAAQCLDDSSSEYRVIPMTRDESEELNPSMMDDDRDLLIVEEEVPGSMRHQSPAVAAVPSTPNVSYPNLFQQLRG